MYKTAWVSSPYGWPDQINAATSYLDLSVIYGSDLYVTDLLRSHYDGELLSDSYTGMPDLIIQVPQQGDRNQGYPSGDERSNENPGLASIVGLWILHHNLLAKEVKKIFPLLDDERLFQEARRRNIAYYQHIVYDELMPQELGLDLGPYQGYNPKTDATTSNEYSSVAGRYYHSGLPSIYHTYNIDMSHHEMGYIDIDAYPQ
jgi:peroxidase